MLTPDQERTIGEVREDPKFSRFAPLIDAAIEGWRNTLTPLQGVWGVHALNNVYVRDAKACGCIIGAALLGKSESYSRTDSAAGHYNLSVTEVEDLANGFDMISVDPRSNDDVAKACGSAVAAALGFGSSGD